MINTEGMKGIFLLSILTLVACHQLVDNHPQIETSFASIPSATSGITFSNDVIENDSLTYFKFPYIYMGGGVAIGDIDKDGFSDIFLTGNMVENKLYLNKGEMRFEDISLDANIQGDERWYTGVTMTDVNNDGFLDIYLCVSGKYTDTHNQLFINNGDRTFTEKAAEFGIDDTSNSIQSTFFDYDKDGDLDLFVANYPLVAISQGNMFYHEKMQENNPSESGHLYQNDGNGHFTDVTAAAGVQNFGLTLGLVSADFNNDGWQDLYLSNDFNVPDYFYLNQGDGTFKEVLKEATGHTSMFAMGIDASDFNNDGLSDLLQVDMTPADYVRARVNMASMNPASFSNMVSMGFHYQYMQNCLQLNNGVNIEGIPMMSEISRLATVATTDWSWSALFVDLDNDEWKDIYITNGTKRDVNNNDVNGRKEATSFQQQFRISVTDFPSEPIANFVYQNQGDFTFKEIGKEWNLDFEGFSNGMSYGDLDNDGDLDLVINNIDQNTSLYRNDTKGSNHLRISLKGTKDNLFGLGTKVTIETESNAQTQEMTLTRGFQSSIEPILHFGLGLNKAIKKVHIVWPDGKEQVINKAPINQLIVIDYADAKDTNTTPLKNTRPFKDITESAEIQFTHSEDLYDDYSLEPLLPYKYSMIGPALAKGDINGDGLEDFYIGSAAGQAGALFIQKSGATFEEITGPWLQDSAQEDAGAVFADFDNDGDEDLYIVSHGNQFQNHTDRLYVNDSGSFIKVSAALPSIITAAKAIAVCDFDKDGLKDVFIGGRNTPGKYPFPAVSYLLKNLGGEDEKIKFSIVNEERTDDLSTLGMVTDAIWIDLDGDSWEDLVVVGEWMPITIFKNEQGSLVNKTEAYGLGESQGWWNAVKCLDIDNDGDLDLVAGNLGVNHKYKSTTNSPFEVYASDFDENGKNDIVLSYHKGKKAVPLRGRECSSQQVPAIAKRYSTFREFAEADLLDIYGERMLAEALHYQVNTFAHTWFENKNGRFDQSHPLPNRAQFSTINAIESIDYNQDQFPDLLIAGNLYQAEAETPKSDAGLGLILTGSPEGFKVVTPEESGLFFRGDIKGISPIRLASDQAAFLWASNNGELQLIAFDKPVGSLQ